MQNLLLRYFHHTHCPTLLRLLTVEGLIYSAHRPLSKLLSKAVGFIRIVRQELNFLYLFVKLVIRQECIIWYDIFLFKTGNDLNHCLWVLFNELLIDLIFIKQFHHLRSEPLDATGTVQVNLQMHLVFKALWAKLLLIYLLMYTG